MATFKMTPADTVEGRRRIRQWAADNGIECPARGRVPRNVTDAYLARATELMNTHTPSDDARRLVVRFDPRSLSLWPESVKAKRATNRLRATVTEYVENTGSRTPNGGRFTSQRFTVVIDGEKWVGQVKKGTDVVRLRPYEEAYPNGKSNGKLNGKSE